MKRLVKLEKDILALIEAETLKFRDNYFYGFSGEEVLRRGREVGQEIFVFERLPRATDFLRQKIKKDPLIKNGLTVLALEMTEAKGRFSRTWVASKGGLWLTIALYDDITPEFKGWVSIIIGFALTETVQAFGVPARQKWINDLWINEKKLAGVLIERSSNYEDAWYLVGVGLNVNNSLPVGLPATSLKEILGHEVNFPEVSAKFLFNLRKYLGLLRACEAHLLQDKKLKNPLPGIFKIFSDTIGRYVAFGEDLTEREEGRGVVIDIDDRGRLLIESSSGRQIKLFSGEIKYL
ncbi:biotin--[acetyl-CoA-carboxylase] ligase [Thermodesulfatator autotrophicus]|uniref:biotin--[biotin carboxyl-carrier protein] ligase n=1 Tax=Thermodesulfatator autotrophicus TaxID=1795632 RepID=A0A177E938_9BACT|nr:biotin--[acetyl-CoA-carboxylase] ligase [Thermodesulfatator autotrophicus]OAG28474.1 hypothetical protein TH606_01865 [Thermodesulfatator autotrophicus]